MFNNCRFEREYGVLNESVVLGRFWYFIIIFLDGWYVNFYVVGKIMFINIYMVGYII